MTISLTQRKLWLSRISDHLRKRQDKLLIKAKIDTEKLNEKMLETVIDNLNLNKTLNELNKMSSAICVLKEKRDTLRDKTNKHLRKLKNNSEKYSTAPGVIHHAPSIYRPDIVDHWSVSGLDHLVDIEVDKHITQSSIGKEYDLINKSLRTIPIQIDLINSPTQLRDFLKELLPSIGFEID